jgi:glycosyltransferase involved in cell wall biosynthesis
MSAAAQEGPREHVAVCVCTYRRPEGLARLLAALAEQQFHDRPRPSLTLVITDNEANPAVETLCQGFAARPFDALLYLREPRRGISHARNTCLANVPAKADFVAMIDDDEIPERDWLEQLLVAQRASDADVIIGPTAPQFEARTPAWVSRSGFFKKPRDQDELVNLQSDPSAATCNALLRAACLARSGVRFHPRLALSGGEDALFFRELRHAGCTFAWAANARVSETIPPHKARLTYMLREEFRRGNVRVFLDRFMTRKNSDSGQRSRSSRLREARRAAKRILQGLGGVLTCLPHWRSQQDQLAMHATRIARGLGMLSGLMGISNAHYR